MEMTPETTVVAKPVKPLSGPVPSVPIARLVELQNQGLTQQKISDRVGLSCSTVGERLRRNAQRQIRSGIRSRANQKRQHPNTQGVQMDANATESAGVNGFRELHNYARQNARRQEQVERLINQAVDKHLRRKAFLDAGGDEQSSQCPRGWFYDSDGPRFANVTGADWKACRELFKDIQIAVSTDTGNSKKAERITWVDPDNVEAYRTALEE